jgi:hypothetical protein
MYIECAGEMLNSRWREQTPIRAKKLADIMAGINA